MWGKPLTQSTLTTAYDELADLNPFRYRGYVWDQETGLYYLRSRYYDAESNRFISADSIQYLCAHCVLKNAYTYCKGSPINQEDSSGNVSEKVADNVIRDNAQHIIKAAEEFDVDLQILAGVIYAEQRLNVDWKDDLTDWLGSTGLIDTSVGIAQVRMSTAESVENDGYMERTEMLYNWMGIIVTEHQIRCAKLSDNETNVRYAAAYLKQLTKAWEPSYKSIAKDPAILGTLYNIGVGTPHKNPEPNDFGRFVRDHYDRMKKLLNV